jgi:hypothetical protein
MGIAVIDIKTDTTLVIKSPNKIIGSDTSIDNANPILQYYKSRMDYGQQQAEAFQEGILPDVQFVWGVPDEGFGFNSDYAVDQHSFTHNYWDGVDPTRQNYLLEWA